MKVQTLDEIRQQLSAKASVNGSRALADEIGVSGAFLHGVMSGKKLPGPKILAFLGYEPLTVYRQSTPTETRRN